MFRKVGFSEDKNDVCHPYSLAWSLHWFLPFQYMVPGSIQSHFSSFPCSYDTLICFKTNHTMDFPIILCCVVFEMWWLCLYLFVKCCRLTMFLLSFRIELNRRLMLDLEPAFSFNGCTQANNKVCFSWLCRGDEKGENIIRSQLFYFHDYIGAMSFQVYLLVNFTFQNFRFVCFLRSPHFFLYLLLPSSFILVYLS